MDMFALVCFYNSPYANLINISQKVFLSLLVYFDRMSRNDSNLRIDSFNIHRLIIAGVTVGSKFFSDVFFTNSRYAKVNLLILFFVLFIRHLGNLFTPPWMRRNLLYCLHAWLFDFPTCDVRPYCCSGLTLFPFVGWWPSTR